MKEKYFPQEIEQKWQKRWADEKTFEVTEDARRKKFYCLEMLAYTSGRAHIGHVSQLFDRRRAGVVQAAAGLQRAPSVRLGCLRTARREPRPSKTAPIPEKFTRDAIAYMKGQFQRMGISYDWSREVATLRSRILQVEPVVLYSNVGARDALSQARAGQLVSEGKHLVVQ